MTTEQLTDTELSDPKTPTQKLEEASRYRKRYTPKQLELLAGNTNTPLSALQALFPSVPGAVMRNASIALEAFKNPNLAQAFFEAANKRSSDPEGFLSTARFYDAIQDPRTPLLWVLGLVRFVSQQQDHCGLAAQYIKYSFAILEAGKHPEIRNGAYREDLNPLYGAELTAENEEWNLARHLTDPMNPCVLGGALDILCNFEPGKAAGGVRSLALGILGCTRNRQKKLVPDDVLIYGSLGYLEALDVDIADIHVGSVPELKQMPRLQDAKRLLPELLTLAAALLDEYPRLFRPELDAIVGLMPYGPLPELQPLLRAYIRHRIPEPSTWPTIPSDQWGNITIQPFRDLCHWSQDSELERFGQDVSQEVLAHATCSQFPTNSLHRVLKFRPHILRTGESTTATGVRLWVIDRSSPRPFWIQAWDIPITSFSTLYHWHEELTPVTSRALIVQSLDRIGKRLEQTPSPPQPEEP